MPLHSRGMPLQQLPERCRCTAACPLNWHEKTQDDVVGRIGCRLLKKSLELCKLNAVGHTGWRMTASEQGLL